MQRTIEEVKCTQTQNTMRRDQKEQDEKMHFKLKSFLSFSF